MEHYLTKICKYRYLAFSYFFSKSNKIIRELEKNIWQSIALNRVNIVSISKHYRYFSNQYDIIRRRHACSIATKKSRSFLRCSSLIKHQVDRYISSIYSFILRATINPPSSSTPTQMLMSAASPHVYSMCASLMADRPNFPWNGCQCQYGGERGGHGYCPTNSPLRNTNCRYGEAIIGFAFLLVVKSSGYIFICYFFLHLINAF